MNLYSVAFPSKNKFEATSTFIYSWDKNLSLGDLVLCPFGKKQVPGVVVELAPPKPKFNFKPISEVLEGGFLTEENIKLFNWITSYYHADPGPTLELFCTQNLISRISKNQDLKNLEQDPEVKKATKLNPLNSTQKKAYREIFESKSNSFVLHGPTGSGKTEVYLHSAKKVLSLNQSVLVLVPEIGLTTQNIARFQELGVPLITLHSKQTPVARAKSWQLIKKLTSEGKPIIVLGPRSTLFSPIRNLGLIIVDEFHDESYKQDSTPKYHAPIVAGALAKFSSSKLIMGSATPNVSELYTLEKKSVPILNLSARTSQKKTTQIIDSRDKDNFGKSRIISTPLLESITQNLNLSEQTMIFHNRRGSARLQLCSSCDWINSCPNCHIPLVFHADDYQLKCHTCGFKSKPQLLCPICKSEALSLRGYGTKQIVAELEKLFPDARIARFDADNTTQDSTLENNFKKIQEGHFDIIVGTQMLAKGLDLPKLSLLGILQAESGLSMPDFRSSERTFQTLTQVIGRVGRGHLDGKVIIQSFAPDHPSIALAAKENYSEFFDTELEERRLTQTPPFRYQLKLSGKYSSEDGAKRASNALLKEVKQDPLSARTQIIGPSPAFRERVGGKYQYQIIIKSANREVLTKLITNHLPTNWNHDLDPLNLL